MDCHAVSLKHVKINSLYPCRILCKLKYFVVSTTTRNLYNDILCRACHGKV